MMKLKMVKPIVDQKKQAALRELRQIPGVGIAVAEDFWNLGLQSVDSLRDADPEALYQQLCDYEGVQVDRCMLYTFRCAVYYATTAQREPELLKWWNWTDEKQAQRSTT
ncbi:MAG: helix-hairpin-helix domain-containing protein [Chloroflexota bacterium]